jgi:hypothetical protein
MNIYFACSITGGHGFESVYQVFVHALAEGGCQVPTPLWRKSGVTAREEDAIHRIQEVLPTQ